LTTSREATDFYLKRLEPCDGRQPSRTIED
jgi:hypothetical protein